MKDYYKHAKKAIKDKEMPKALYNAYIKNGMSERLGGVIRRTADLFEENASAAKAVRMHYEQILPCIAYYEDLLQKMDSQEEAYAFYDKYVLEEIRKTGTMIQKVMKIPGLYKTIPWLFNVMVKKIFGEASGFSANDLKIKGAFAMDMLVCPYTKTCIRYGHFEIAHYFCDSDDITYGNMHPCLIWKRTKTIGRGDDICDFRLYKKEKNHSFWDRAAYFYDFFMTLKNGRGNRKLGRRVAGLIEPEDHVLECACGTGMITKYIAGKCAFLTATDFSEGMLKKTGKKCGHFSNVSIEQADITKLDYPDNRFDKVVAANVIHLLDDPKKALDELMRVCRPGGKIIIPTFINLENEGKNSLFIKITGKLGAHFKNQFTYETYKDFFGNNGFKHCKFLMIRGNMPCAIAVLTCEKGRN